MSSDMKAQFAAGGDDEAFLELLATHGIDPASLMCRHPGFECLKPDSIRPDVSGNIEAVVVRSVHASLRIMQRIQEMSSKRQGFLTDDNDGGKAACMTSTSCSKATGEWFPTQEPSSSSVLCTTTSRHSEYSSDIAIEHQVTQNLLQQHYKPFDVLAELDETAEIQRDALRAHAIYCAKLEAGVMFSDADRDKYASSLLLHVAAFDESKPQPLQKT